MRGDSFANALPKSAHEGIAALGSDINVAVKVEAVVFAVVFCADAAANEPWSGLTNLLPDRGNVFIEVKRL